MEHKYTKILKSPNYKIARLTGKEIWVHARIFIHVYIAVSLNERSSSLGFLFRTLFFYYFFNIVTPFQKIPISYK